MPARDFYVPLNTPSLGGPLLAREENFKTSYIREEERKDFCGRSEEFFSFKLSFGIPDESSVKKNTRGGA
ncbi:MAG: hypothetical protein Q8O01_06015, partial [Candidatus Omnitrophota bacterium]|nr:hypothetical protein [Candidatus Omnitrophota bacterium]